MNADELFNKIEELINNKKTHPKLLTFAELRHNVEGDKKVLRESFNELKRQGRIRVRAGKNDGLIEILSRDKKD